MLRRILAIFFLAGLLAACGAPATTPTPAAQPTVAVSEPTSAPTPVPTVEPPTATSAPTTIPTVEPAAPTSTPSPAGTLPAPLYVLEGGQVVRIDVDGTTKTTLTDEQPFTSGALAIVDLAVSPADEALAYVVQGSPGSTLVVTDSEGENRRVLLEEVPVAAPRWSPDGPAITVQMGPPLADDSPWDAGLWVVSAVSGEARLLIANDPVAVDGWGYGPEAWSPDGSKLLVSRFSQSVESCDAAILDVASGELTVLQAPAGSTPGLQVQCAGGAWAQDSASVYVILRGPGLVPPEPGLYRADVATGALEMAIPGQITDGHYAVVHSQYVSSSGDVYALVTLLDQMPDPATYPSSPPPSASLYRVGQDGTLERLRDEEFSLFGRPVWAPDDSGVVVPTASEGGGVAHVYVPFEGDVVQLTIEPTEEIAWGK